MILMPATESHGSVRHAYFSSCFELTRPRPRTCRVGARRIVQALCGQRIQSTRRAPRVCDMSRMIRAGMTRRKSGNRFVYRGLDGKIISDPAELARIKSLVIPPAWREVWICPVANGHLQATGRDARGRKQHRYHPRWREIRDANKYDRMIDFAKRLPAIRRKVDEDLAVPGLPREKVLATVVRLLETSRIRVGNEEYARQNNSFGVRLLPRPCATGTERLQLARNQARTASTRR